MPSTYSDLKVELMATGENNTTWGQITNVNLEAIEEAIVGSADVTFASANVTLSLTDTNAPQTARNVRLRCTGVTGGSTRNLVVPSIEKPYVVRNDCADSIVVKTAAGSGVTVPAGKTLWVYSDGTNVVDVTNHLSSLTLGTPLPVTSGGTGATDAATARANLGAGTGNGTVTSVNASGGTTGLTFSGGPITNSGTITMGGTLGVANGGTGATSITSGRLVKGNGTGAFTASGIVDNSDAVAITIDSSENVGIGTSPIANTRLYVRTAAATDTAYYADNGVNSGFIVRFASALTSFGNDFGAPLALLTNNTERMRITSTGDVGIGTSSPDYKLDIAAHAIASGVSGGVRIGAETDQFSLRLISATTGLGVPYAEVNGPLDANGWLAFNTGNPSAERMRIDSSGNLGIGTTTPGQRLDVSGNANISGALTLGTALAVAQGGTGATTAPAARTNLGAAASGAVTASGLTMTTARILGRTTAATGAIEEITVGSGLSLTAGTLTATGSGGTVTSVSGTGTVNGITLTGTVTSSGSLTLGGTLSGVSLTTQVTGTLPIGNGGTGATTAPAARTNLGATTVGSNLFTLTDPSAIRFLRINADNTVTARAAADFRTDIGAAASGANTDITSLAQSTSVAATGTAAADSIGYRGLPQNSQTTGYTLVLADQGKHISITTGGVTIPANGTTAFPVGTTIVVFNNSASTQTIAITTDTLRLAGTATTGTRTLAAYGLCTLVKVGTTTWVATGNVT